MIHNDVNDDSAIEIEMLSAAYDKILVSKNDNNDTIIKINDINNSNIRLILPILYPKESLKISLESRILSYKDQSKLLNQLKVKAIERAKEEMICCFEIIQDINDYIEDNNKVITHNDNDDDNNKTDIDNNDRISRTFIYFHHIKSLKKKKDICDFASELKLGGIWKGIIVLYILYLVLLTFILSILIEGFPGLILAEGNHFNILEFIARLKRLRWQQMTVKGIWINESEDNNLVFTTFNEVSDLSSFSQICNEKNLTNIYRTSMGLPDI